MQVTLEHKIKGLEGYCVGSDGLVYRLPYTDEKGGSRQLRIISLLKRETKKDTGYYTKGYWVFKGSKKEWLSIHQLNLRLLKVSDSEKVFLHDGIK